MKLKDMTKAELEVLTNCDITVLLLKQNKKPMNTPSIFKEICTLLGYSDEEYTNKIGDFYTSLTIDKRFILLDTAEWDLKDNHAVKISIDEDEEEIIEEEIDIDEEIESDEDEEDDIEEPLEDDDLDLDDDTDDIDDLSVIDEEEMEG